MPRNRPHLSITLPRNFTFHYTEGEEPKTPERETSAPLPQSPQAYRIKRRSRPNISSISSADHQERWPSSDVPIPTIETPISMEPVRPVFQQQMTELAEGFLAPRPNRHFMTSPRTPAPQSRLADDWGLPKSPSGGEKISRPTSACSTMSDSSDESNGSFSSHPSLGGSCTSPESDAPDPFRLPSAHKGKGKVTPWGKQPTPDNFRAPKPNHVHWTSEMDRHLWATYLIYLQDPTVTPFKMLPGTAPPLGVCHRVAREAQRTWRGLKITSRKPSDVVNLGRSNCDFCPGKPRGSPDTIKPDRSGSNTPTGFSMFRQPVWPKSGSSTRRRLRELCRRKPTMAPYYQRMLQGRSSSPESFSSRSQTRSQIGSSPFNPQSRQTSFSTRDIHFSLTTSTAATMQPDGPLAQLASRTVSSPQPEHEWFNDPIVPWASPTSIPSDLGLENARMDGASTSNQLGSPFGYHTWGPSRSRHYQRTSAFSPQQDALSPTEPSLKSPVRLHGTFPYPSGYQRRTQYDLADEFDPEDADMRKTLIESLFGGPGESRHRHTRSRGFSLGDVNANGGRLESLFTPPSALEIPETTATASTTEMDTSEPSSLSVSDSIKRLGSPFPGGGSGGGGGGGSSNARLFRRSPRHITSASLSAYDPSNFSSIDQTLGQANLKDELRRRFDA